ncbi:MAG TPA: hypothetical protein VME63_03190 [Dyella sp.]|uniref:hypothetical protein n=1 Tax=Dyella sp. TaxID=1869338 RepID=UPI002CA7DC82|nr:hypothetical protein [Dyella sp.]HTV84380.1 hypothetical protein [Dyella sp.]
MKLSIKSFADVGVLEKERLVLRVLEDVDIGDYLVLRSKKSKKTGYPISGSSDAYWFPDEEVKAGDLVVIYTREGKASKKEISDGRTAHFYYWKKEQAFWGDDGNKAVLIETGSWRSKAPSESDPSDE